MPISIMSRPASIKWRSSSSTPSDIRGSIENLYPRLLDFARSDKVPDTDGALRHAQTVWLFRYRIQRALSENVPWYIKAGHANLLAGLNIPLHEYPSRCEDNIATWHQLRSDLEGPAPIEVKRSNEYAA
ncbi:MAG: hypothetical protein ABI414_11980, partial [Devosia sp.]